MMYMLGRCFDDSRQYSGLRLNDRCTNELSAPGYEIRLQAIALPLVFLTHVAVLDAAAAAVNTCNPGSDNRPWGSLERYLFCGI